MFAPGGDGSKLRRRGEARPRRPLPHWQESRGLAAARVGASNLCLEVLRRSVSLAAVGILAVMLTACTGGGGGYLPPDTVFTGKASFGSQVEQAYKNVLEVLRSVGTTQENVVKQTILVAKGQDIRSGYAAAQRVWGAHPIALTVHIVDGFGIPGALVGIEAVCALGE